MDAKQEAQAVVARSTDRLIRLSHEIHAHPELAWEEEWACARLTEALDEAGFAVEKGCYGLPTAFVARAGTGPLHIGICAEYDALPGLGHACGHNIIAAAALGAGLAAAQVADDLALTVSVIGTPAEEVADGSGKVLMLERGAFADVHAAMMIHPAPGDLLDPKIIAAAMFDVYYKGRAAHAAAAPHLGINAADALVVAQTAVGLLRQHIRPDDRIHGIVTHGGDAPNVVPAHASARYMVRAATLAELFGLRDRVYHCFEAGALATGAALTITGGTKPDAEGRWDRELASLFGRNAGALGRTFPRAPAGAATVAASTDMANVSHVIPTIHPMLGIDSLPAFNHQAEFTAHAITDAGNRAVIDGAIAMAWTIIDAGRVEPLRARLLRRELCGQLEPEV